MPKVSICIPAYRNPEGIARLLASVREQRFSDYEVILTDDSPDGSVEAAARQAGIEKLRYFRNETRKGAAANWNRAVEQARGDYIKMMHHDDWFAGPDSLGRFAALLDDAPEAVLAFSGSWQVALGAEAKEELESQRKAAAEAGTLRTGMAFEKDLPDRFARHISAEKLTLIRADWRNLFLGNVIGAPSAVIWRINGQLFAEELTWLVDMEFYMRLLRKAEHQNRMDTARTGALSQGGAAGSALGTFAADRPAPGFVCTGDPLVCIGISGGQLTRACSGNGALNIREYGYVYQEFSLDGAPDGKTYSGRLLEIATQYGRPYAALKPYGIGKRAYGRARREKWAADLLFFLDAVKRKLRRNGA